MIFGKLIIQILALPNNLVVVSTFARLVSLISRLTNKAHICTYLYHTPSVYIPHTCTRPIRVHTHNAFSVVYILLIASISSAKVIQ